MVTPPLRGATFQSTPPSRVATRCCPRGAGQRRHFNPHHPRGWRLTRSKTCPTSYGISIHTTLAGGDWQAKSSNSYPIPFQSTPPSRVATIFVGVKVVDVVFQSTPPSRVATVERIDGIQLPVQFQSTPPSRVATYPPQKCLSAQRLFQSTPPSRVATSKPNRTKNKPHRFQSTPPSRVATI